MEGTKPPVPEELQKVQKEAVYQEREGTGETKISAPRLGETIFSAAEQTPEESGRETGLRGNIKRLSKRLSELPPSLAMNMLIGAGLDPGEALKFLTVINSGGNIEELPPEIADKINRLIIQISPGGWKGELRLTVPTSIFKRRQKNEEQQRGETRAEGEGGEPSQEGQEDSRLLWQELQEERLEMLLNFLANEKTTAESQESEEIDPEDFNSEGIARALKQNFAIILIPHELRELNKLRKLQEKPPIEPEEILATLKQIEKPADALFQIIDNLGLLDEDVKEALIRNPEIAERIAEEAIPYWIESLAFYHHRKINQESLAELRERYQTQKVLLEVEEDRVWEISKMNLFDIKTNPPLSREEAIEEALTEILFPTYIKKGAEIREINKKMFKRFPRILERASTPGEALYRILWESNPRIARDYFEYLTSEKANDFAAEMLTYTVANYANLRGRIPKKFIEMVAKHNIDLTKLFSNINGSVEIEKIEKGKILKYTALVTGALFGLIFGLYHYNLLPEPVLQQIGPLFQQAQNIAHNLLEQGKMYLNNIWGSKESSSLPPIVDNNPPINVERLKMLNTQLPIPDHKNLDIITRITEFQASNPDINPDILKKLKLVVR